MQRNVVTMTIQTALDRVTIDRCVKQLRSRRPSRKILTLPGTFDLGYSHIKVGVFRCGRSTEKPIC
jgi:hypothetical protein